MQPIAKQRMDDNVYQQLLDKIKSGDWKSGEKLPSENELCKILNVSRVTVRAAIQRLQSLGLVEAKQGKGTFICSNEDLFDYSGFSGNIDLTKTEYREINELREALEKLAVQKLMECGSCDTTYIQKAYDGMLEAAKTLDYIELTKHDLIFHSAIMAAAGNTRLIRVLRIFQDDYYRVLLETNKLLMRDFPDDDKVRKHFNECLLNHKNLLDALAGLRGNALEEQERFLQRNRERVEFFFRKHHNAASEL